MKNNIAVLIAGVLLCAGGWAQATGVDFNTDSVIQNGDNYTNPPYDYIALHNSATVTMTGGNISTAFTAYDTSTFDLQAGFMSGGTFYGHSTGIISGGTCGGFAIHDSSTLSISGGSIADSLINMYDSSVLNLSGGNFMGYVYSHSTINIFGRDLNIVPTSYSPDSIASGHWADGTSFQFTLARYQAYNPQVVFHEVPEPASLLLIGAVGLLIRKTKSVI